MKTLVAAALTACLIGWASVAVANEDPGALCDQYAASSYDTTRPAGVKGRFVFEIFPKLALPACEAAVARYPQEPRYLFQLGRVYDKLDRVDEALEHYVAAGDAGLGAALYSVGHFYDEGVGVQQDHELAMYYYDLAAAKDISEAHNALGTHFRDGIGTPVDHVRANEHFAEGARLGSVLAGCNLGVAYVEGLGMPVDPSRAVPLYEAGVAAGMGNCFVRLADLYLEGIGVEQDRERAIALYREAYQRGSEQVRQRVRDRGFAPGG